MTAAVSRPAAGGHGARGRSTGGRADLRVAPSLTRRRRTGLVAVVAVALGVIALFGNALLSGVLVANQSELDDIEAKIELEQARNERGRLEVAELAAPERVVSAARDEGMVTPDQTHWLTPRSDATGVEQVTAPGTDNGVTEEAASRADGPP